MQLLQQLSQPHPGGPDQRQQQLQLQQAVRRLEAHAGGLSPQQLQQLLLAAASAAASLPAGAAEQLLQLLDARLAQQLPQLTPTQLAAALTHLHRASTAQQPQQQQARRALTLAVNAFCRQLLGQRRHQQQQQGRQPAAPATCDAASTTALVTALSLPGYQQHSTFTLLAMLAMDHVPAMTPQQLAELMAGFAAAQHWNQAVTQAALKQAAAILQQQQHQLLPDQPADHEQPQQPGVAAFTVAQLVQLLESCGQLRHHDPSFLDAAVTAALRSLPGGVLSVQQVVAVAHTCALLNHYSVPFFQEACRLVSTHAQQSQQPQQQQHPGSADDGSNGVPGPTALAMDLAYACAVLGHVDPPFLQQLAALTSRVDLRRLTQQQLLQWFEVWSSLTDAAVQQPELRSNHWTSHDLLAAAQGAWIQQLAGRRSSKFQQQVRQAFQAIGRNCRINVALDGPHIVDIELRMQHRSKVAVQLEGPEAFSANAPHAPLGPTSARWRALQARGWQVLVVRSAEWQRLQSAEERCLYAMHVKEAAATRAPGLAMEIVKMEAGSGGGGAAAAADRSRGLSLGKKLWKMLLD